MPLTRIMILIPLIIALFFTAPVFAKLPEAEKNGHPTHSIADMLSEAMPAVVNITVIGEVAVRRSKQTDSPTISKQFQEMGSGVILDGKEGHIVTNAHVVKNAKVITVMLSDGRRLKARVVGSDALSDLAVLKINGNGLVSMPVANSDKLKVGDFVAAIGNPFGLHQTVTSGVVSALHRSNLGIEGYENFIQTDASINPGNSGGALVNLSGELVGINTALIGPIGGNVGIGLAIPSNMVTQIIDQLIKVGRVNRGVVGIMVQNLTPELADALNLKGKKGALVTNVVDGSPAQKAGLQQQDVIDRINDTEIKSGTQVRNIIGLLPVDTKLKLYIQRQNKSMVLEAVIMDTKEFKNSTEPAIISLFDGVRLTSYDELVPKFGKIKGVGVLDVDETSDAWISNLRPGDVILEANAQEVEGLDKLMEVVKGQTENVLLKVGRGRAVIFLVLNSYS